VIPPRPGDRLFNQGPLHAVFDRQHEALSEAVKQIGASTIRDGDEAAIVTDLRDRFSVEPLQFTEGAISAEAAEAQVEDPISWDLPMGIPEFVPGIRVSYFIPFTGNRNLFKYQPRAYSLHAPEAEVRANELVLSYYRTDNDVSATRPAFDQEFAHAKQWLTCVNEEVEKFNSALPLRITRLVEDRRSRLRQIAAGADGLGVTIRAGSGSTSQPLAAGSRDGTSRSTNETDYDVALSFAGEDRDYVEAVARSLKDKGVRVFYDEYEKVDMWGKNLVDHLAQVYQKRSRFVVMFISKHSVRKPWPTHERQHAQARALVAREEYILPARFDDTEVPGLTPTVAHIDLRGIAPKDFAALVHAKLR
jgi:TIR domain